jgi:signal peptidase II
MDEATCRIRGINMEFLFISLIVALDQITKFLVKLKLRPLGNVDLINGYFSLTYVENRGAAFGIFHDKKWMLVGVTAIVIIFMLFYLGKHRNASKWIKISFVLIIAGAIGNLIDRVYLSYVVDFIHFYVKSHDLPVFNFADMSVVSGTILLAINLLLAKD